MVMILCDWERILSMRNELFGVQTGPAGNRRGHVCSIGGVPSQDSRVSGSTGLQHKLKSKVNPRGRSMLQPVDDLGPPGWGTSCNVT